MSARPTSSNSAAKLSSQSPLVSGHDVQSIAARPVPTTPSKTYSRSSSLIPGSPSSTTPSRSHHYGGVASDLDGGDAAKHFSGRQLWSSADEPKSCGSSARPSTSRRFRQSNRSSSLDRPGVSEVHPADITTTPGFILFRQPKTKVISQDQLVGEVKGIYEGLTMVEAKCIEISASPRSRIREDQDLDKEQYQKLIGLHRMLLNEHHDFFLACQHPSANAAVRRLPMKYSMPARMWRYGIQSFLELLRKRLPGSREYMLTFVCIAYSTMALSYETVPGFVATWIEYLGDLGRYRMAIEDDDIRDREIWTGVSRYWYAKASDRSPEVGRLYHHLAILARSDGLQKLYYYNKSLCVPIPFPSAWNSIMTLFKLVLERSKPLDPSDEVFVRAHAILFTGRNADELDGAMAEFLGTLDRSIAKRNTGWLHSGYYMAIALICSLLGNGMPTNPLKQALPAGQGDGNAALSAKNVMDKETAEKKFNSLRTFSMQTCSIVFRRKADINALPFFHTILVFLWYVAQHPGAMALLENEFPWALVVDVLNEAIPALISKPRMVNKSFPRPPRNEPQRPLPEDYAMRGLGFSKGYFPPDWFSSDKLEDDEKMFEPPSLGDERRQRVLWLGYCICSLGDWFEWDKGSHRFTMNEEGGTDSTGGRNYPRCAADLWSQASSAQTDSPAAPSSVQQPGVPATPSQQAPMSKTSRSHFDERMIDRLNSGFCRR
ncbi:hypothetical protein BBAD15_g6921 [Beauveria bassiana D1-5]|uniref:DNA/RNA-binding domain-containing protein n=1 Tax=Beauveria bassiana D1-5 TaxID=1245745 RepID=A0A0A2VN66_BEABA|nr:hypothetical protein BBAD15_g6921 [Beauveria bassiana D1-5]